MKKLLTLLLCALLLLPLLACSAKDVSAVPPMTGGLDAYLDAYPSIKDGPLYGSTVTVYNWGEYMDTDLNKEFKELTGITVKYRNFTSNETLRSSLADGGASYDVVIPSDYMIGQLIEENLLVKMDYTKLGNYKYLLDAYKNTAYDPNNEYSMPYMTGTVGIVYNTTKVTGEVDSWDILFDPQYSGQILMFDNSRDALGIALLKLGYSLNTTSETELREAQALLTQQKPLVQSYVMDQIYDKMIAGEAVVGPYYAGDAVMMMEENEDLDFAFPKEGTNAFIDAFVIPKTVKNTAGAYLYIDFMSSVESGHANVTATGYTTPLRHVYEDLPESVRLNPIIFPSDDILENTEIYLNLPSDTRRLYDNLWVDLFK